VWRGKTLVFVGFGLLVVVIGAQRIVMCTLAQVKRMQTLDTMGQVGVALDRTLPSQPSQWPIVGYNPAKETKRLFPDVRMVQSEIADAWGRPITISVECHKGSFLVRMISAGKDGVIGTSDDITKEVSILYGNGIANK
jgi:hypothetical protein